MVTLHRGPRIISASRRTDIPAFYTPWLLARLEAGFADYWHPFGFRWYRVSLRPEDVVGIVFWSKNYGPLIPHLPEIAARGYRFYCEFTITGLPREMERHVPPTERAIEQLRTISRTFSPDHVNWRFDPIVIQPSGTPETRDQRPETKDPNSELRIPNPELSTQNFALAPEETIGRFLWLCDRLAGFTRRCTISFMHPYAKVRRNLAGASIPFVEPPTEEKCALAGELAHIASEHGIRLYSCADDSLVGVEAPTFNASPSTIHALHPTSYVPCPLRGHCIGLEQLLAVGATVPKTIRVAPVTPDCGCLQAIDIGAYDTCPHGCVYCYANANQAAAVRNLQAHLPSAPSLGPHGASGGQLGIGPD